MRDSVIAASQATGARAPDRRQPARAAPGPKLALIHARIASGSMSKLGRPTIAPADVARRFKAFLAHPATAGTVPLAAAGAA